MASTTASTSNLAGAWFGELASALQGTWQAAAATGEGPRPARQLQHQQQKPARGDSNSSKAARGAAAAAGRDKQGGDDVVRCGGAMSDTTLYLLLDRFSPS